MGIKDDLLDMIVLANFELLPMIAESSASTPERKDDDEEEAGMEEHFGADCF